MKSLFTLIAILGFSFTSMGQDLIITTTGDSIKCKIINVSADQIRYQALIKHEVKKIKIPASQVKSYVEDFYTPKNMPASAAIPKTNYDRFTISPSVGFSYLLARVSSQVPTSLKPYIKELKSGYHVGADATYFLSSRTGVGLKYTSFRTSNETFVTSNNQSGTLRDDVTTQYIAAVLASRRMLSNQKTAFISNLSLGYLAYRNDATVIDNFKLTGGTVGLGFDLGIDHKLSKSFGLAFKLGMVAGSLGEYKKSVGNSEQTITLEDDQRENLTRLDVSVGLKWHY